MIPLYRGMIDSWVADGPTDDLAGTTAGIILSDPDLSAAWIAKWQAWPPAEVNAAIERFLRSLPA